MALGRRQRRISSSSPESSLGAVFSAQVIEHLPYAELSASCELSHSRLRAGRRAGRRDGQPARAACAEDASGSTRPTSIRCSRRSCSCSAGIAGFDSAYVFHPLGTGHVEDDRYRESEYAVVATKT